LRQKRTKSEQAITLAMKNRWDEAAQLNREILEIFPNEVDAYNRLGILYAKQRAYTDAIECFEIAQSLEPSASSLHNVGLIYYETGQFDKAAEI